MPDLPSFDDLFNIARDEMLSRSPKLTATVIETQGTETNIVTAAAAAVGDEVVGQLSVVAAALYLDSATGNDLDRLVFDRYGLTRKQAAPAIGTVVFSLLAPAVGAFNIPSGTVLQALNGLQFVTTAPATFSAGAFSVNAFVRSTLAGANQQAAIGTINGIVSPIPGAPAGLSVMNNEATAGASDVETDDSLRNRARTFFTTARRGTIAAIQAGALNVPGVQTATAFEVLDALGRPQREVQLVISDQFTTSLVNISPTPATYQAQSNALAIQVQAGLEDVRAAGIYVSITVAQVELEAIQLALTFSAGVDTTAVSTVAVGVVVNYVNGLSPGASLTVAALVGALRAVAGLVVTGSEIVAPAGGVVAFPLQVLRTSPALVTVL
jgi:hypothetical protein